MPWSLMANKATFVGASQTVYIEHPVLAQMSALQMSKNLIDFAR